MAESGEATLLIQGGPNSGMTISLSGRPITLGRRQENDIVVDQTEVSRRHALIMETEVGYIVRDLNSTNGTYVNRQRLGEGDQSLKHGDQIRLAGSDVTLIFRHEGSPTAKITLPDADEVPAEAISLDGRSKEVYLSGKKLEPPLDDKEFDLLRFLHANRGSVVSLEDLARNVWPELPSGEVSSHDINQYVDRVRGRIEKDPSNPELLVTIGEFGYRLE